MPNCHKVNYFRGYKFSWILKILLNKKNSWKNFEDMDSLQKFLPHVASTWRQDM